jgi:hypothetical protein
MLPRSTRPPALATGPSLPPSVASDHVTARSRVISFSAPHVADREVLLEVPVGLSTRAVVADPCQAEGTRTRIVRPAPHGAPETLAKVGHCPPATSSHVVCADDARCVCPLSGHFTDPERDLMNDITRQAARLSTTLLWLLALVALAGLVWLMRWSR